MKILVVFSVVVYSPTVYSLNATSILMPIKIVFNGNEQMEQIIFWDLWLSGTNHLINQHSEAYLMGKSINESLVKTMLYETVI